MKKHAFSVFSKSVSNERTKIRIAPIERGPCGKNESEFSEDSDRNGFDRNQFDFGRMRN